MAQSHDLDDAHAARNHWAAVASAVLRLFVNTPDAVPENQILNFVKEDGFGIRNGLPIIDKDHPVIVEMLAQDILGTQPTPVRALLPSSQAGGYLPAILPQLQGHLTQLSLQMS
jgi:hypothetical protein